MIHPYLQYLCNKFLAPSIFYSLDDRKGLTFDYAKIISSSAFFITDITKLILEKTDISYSHS